MGFGFYNANLVNTTSQIYLSSGSGTANGLFDRYERIKWSSSGEAADGNTATVSIVFSSATAISDIIMINHNAKAFNIIYNSNTANQFTPGLSITGNTNSNTMHSFATTTVNSIDINMWNTHVAGAEKFIGELIISKGKKAELDTNPDFNSYIPVRRNFGSSRQLLDGGFINIRNSVKFSAILNVAHINTQTHSDLLDIWNTNSKFLFVPFADTFTANFEGTAKEVVWAENFNLDQFRQNNRSGGYKGSIDLRETPF